MFLKKNEQPEDSYNNCTHFKAVLNLSANINIICFLFSFFIIKFALKENIETMKRYKEISNAYRGKEGELFLVEGKGDKALNRYIRGHRKYIESYLRQRGIALSRFSFISTSLFGSRSVKNLILRQCPTMSKEELERAIKSAKHDIKEKKSCLLYIIDTETDENGNCTADILREDNFTQDCGYESTLLSFLDTVIACEIEKSNRRPASIGSGMKFRLPDKEEEFCDFYPLEEELLAGNIYKEKSEVVSPLHFDSKYNITLPLYPQITIKLEPVPKSLFILFLLHPEGIVLKDIQNYEEELMNIYFAVSGRKNPTMLKRVCKSLTDPTGNPLQKNISVIRKSFTSKLNHSIAGNYIPAHNRKAAHHIPLDSSMVVIPRIA